MSSTPVSIPKRALPTRKVGERYGVSARSVLRWENQKVIPKADLIINGRRYWWIETLDRHDRARTAAAGGKRVKGTEEDQPAVD
jgi:DNA-binding transcriptional MerR regulator